MGIIILLGFIVVLCIALYFLDEIFDWDMIQGISFVLGFVSSAFFVFLLLSTLTLEADFQKDLNKYEALTGYIDNARSQDLSEFERFKAIDQITEMNDKIATHRAYKDNLWIGIWVSDKIASLEYIK